MKERRFEYLDELVVGIKEMETRLEEGQITVGLQPRGLGNRTLTTNFDELVAIRPVFWRIKFVFKHFVEADLSSCQMFWS